MIIQKIFFHVAAFFENMFYHLFYNNRVKIGKGTTWRRNFSLMIGKNGKVIIGDNCFFNNQCSIASLERVEIGDNSIFGENVKIYDHNHKFHNGCLIKSQGFSKCSVKIGNDCWIGTGVIILKDTVIGDGCIIGAGVGVKGIVPDNTIIRNIEGKYEYDKRK